MKYFVLLILLSLSTGVSSQSRKPVLRHRTISVDIVPGLGTSGLNPGGVSSNFSLNLISGYKFFNRGIELSAISSIHVSETRGFQISGIASITGLNFNLSPFIQPEDEANLTGLQLSGIYNFVRDYIHGAQIAGIYNRGRNLFGLQLSATNRLSGFGFGAQLGVIYNWSHGSFDGVQAGLLINETNNRLVGLQLAGLNIAGSIEGKNSDQGGKYTAFQIGLVNFSGDMHGFQFGLINIAGKMRGTQIGLINIGSSRETPVGIRNGTMIGLFNAGLFHSLGIYTGEMFLYNIALETGSHKNRQRLDEGTNRYVTSRLEYGFSPVVDGFKRQAGLSVRKYYYNRTQTPGMNERMFVSSGVGLFFMQAAGEKFDFSLPYGMLILGGGYRPFKKIGVHMTAEFTLNYSWNSLDDRGLPAGAKTLNGNDLLWPGWRVGLQLH